jgi:hypothetical protein
MYGRYFPQKKGRGWSTGSAIIAKASPGIPFNTNQVLKPEKESREVDVIDEINKMIIQKFKLSSKK